MNVAVYYRVSTVAQAADDRYGLEAQRVDVEKYCKENDLTIIKEFVDDGYSGATINRPALTELLGSDITNPPFEAVVSAKTDRIARNSELYYFISYNLKKKKLN